MREKITKCAKTIINDIWETMIIPTVHDEWNDELDASESERIANIVYEQIKLRM